MSEQGLSPSQQACSVAVRVVDSLSFTLAINRSANSADSAA